MKVARGTIVDATLLSAPSSTKNRDQKRDPDMHQTQKGNQWHFGMKAHIGVDSKSKISCCDLKGQGAPNEWEMARKAERGRGKTPGINPKPCR